MKRWVIIIILSTLFLSCNENKKPDYSELLLSSKLKEYINEFMYDHPHQKLFGLYFYKYEHDSTFYLLTSHYPSVRNVYRNKPDFYLTINGRYVIINYGLHNLSENDSLTAKRMVEEMLKNKFPFENDEYVLYHPQTIMITVRNGKYTKRNAISSIYIPTSGVIQDTSAIMEYLPAVEELKE